MSDPDLRGPGPPPSRSSSLFSHSLQLEMPASGDASPVLRRPRCREKCRRGCRTSWAPFPGEGEVSGSFPLSRLSTRTRLWGLTRGLFVLVSRHNPSALSPPPPTPLPVLRPPSYAPYVPLFSCPGVSRPALEAGVRSPPAPPLGLGCLAPRASGPPPPPRY